MMPQDEQRYKRWRQMWLSGGNSQAITTMIFHGLCKALTLTARLAPQPQSAAAHLSAVELPICDTVITAAAQCTRRLLIENPDQPILAEAV